MLIESEKRKLVIAAIVVLYRPDQRVRLNIGTYAEKVNLVILVDNTDQADTLISFEIMEKLNVEYPEKCCCIPMGKNFGIAAALNRGVKKAEELRATHVLTMDQDSYFVNDITEIYQDYISRNPKKRVLLVPNYICDRKKRRGLQGEESVKRVVLAMQSGCLLCVKDYERIGGFKEELFMDGVDFEYCLRARQAGIEVVQCRDALLHHEPASAGQKKILGRICHFGVAPPLRYYYQIRNLTWTFFQYKNIEILKWLFIKCAKIILLFDHKEKYLKLAAQGLWDGLHNRLGEYEIDGQVTEKPIDYREWRRKKSGGG